MRCILLDYFTLWLAILYNVIVYILDYCTKSETINTAIVIKVSVQLLKSNLIYFYAVFWSEPIYR